MNAAPEFSEGQQVGDYVLQDLLGVGQDGEVWLVTKLSLGKKFAAKFLRSLEEDQQERFDREVSILAGLNDPNIVTIVDRAVTTNPVTGNAASYYVMELIDSEPIDKVLHNAPKRTLFCELFEQVVSGLKTIHGEGISGLPQGSWTPGKESGCQLEVDRAQVAQR